LPPASRQGLKKEIKEVKQQIQTKSPTKITETKTFKNDEEESSDESDGNDDSDNNESKEDEDSD
jgi:hypothetical protein